MGLLFKVPLLSLPPLSVAPSAALCGWILPLRSTRLTSPLLCYVFSLGLLPAPFILKFALKGKKINQENNFSLTDLLLKPLN